MKFIFTIIAAVLLAGCVSTPNLISGSPTAGSLPLPITNPTVVTDLQSAAFNLDNAVTVGALAADDPAPKCIHDVLVKAGIEIPPGATPAKTFVPKKDGVASAGAIAYIIAQQAKAIARNPLVVDPSCEALLGRVVMDGASAMNKAVPAFIPGLLR